MSTQPKYENIRKCRLLKESGYSDHDLMKAGFDSVTISRVFTAVTGRNQTGARCRECGRKFYRLNRDKQCLACETEQNAPRLELVRTSILSDPSHNPKPKKLTHPDILQ